jgi:adenosine deaminase
MGSIGSFIAKLPKVELHVHLVGSASVATVLELARRHPDGPVPRTADGLREFYEFRDFPHFIEVYQAVSALLTEPEDIAGLHCVPHAGETSGPETVWEAIDFLHAERLGHGIRSMEDPRLIAYLRETQLPVDVSPTSNVRTRCVPSLGGHPLPRMLEAGLYVTVNSDDPPMFGTTLSNEYLVAASEFGLSAAQLAGLAANAVRASFLDDASKDALTGEIAAVLAEWG